MKKNRLIKKYLKLEEEYCTLKDLYEEVCSEYTSVNHENKINRKKLFYYESFVDYHKLEYSFDYFEEHAFIPEDSELPFPYYTL